MNRLMKILLTIMLLQTSVHLSADNLWSYTLGFTGSDMAVSGVSSDTYYVQQMIGVDLRGSAVLESSGFYYGTFISVSFPVSLEEINPYLETIEYLTPNHNLVAIAGVPFGFRAPLYMEEGGFYTGFGPGVMVSADYDDHLWVSGLIALEMGMEHIARKGVSLGFGLRAYVGLSSILVNLKNFDQFEYSSAPDPMVLSLVMGISWTSIRN